MLPLWQDYQGALDVGHLPSISAIPPGRAAADLLAFACAHDPIISVHPSSQGQDHGRALPDAVSRRCVSPPNRSIANREVRV